MRDLWVLTAVAMMAQLGAGLAHAQEPQSDHHRPVARERYQELATQHVKVDEFPADGWVLAIGGGGEGVIGQLAGAKTVAIDINRRELEEAAPGPLKVVMDARDLEFLDGSFAAAASFFTLCYIDGDDHPKVMAEAFRVLAPGGRLRIWDVILAETPGNGKDRALVPLEVTLPDRTIQTGYGVSWPGVPHDLPYYTTLAEKAGFRVITSRTEESWFYLELEKPRGPA